MHKLINTISFRITYIDSRAYWYSDTHTVVHKNYSSQNWQYFEQMKIFYHHYLTFALMLFFRRKAFKRNSLIEILLSWGYTYLQYYRSVFHSHFRNRIWDCKVYARERCASGDGVSQRWTLGSRTATNPYRTFVLVQCSRRLSDSAGGRRDCGDYGSAAGAAIDRSRVIGVSTRVCRCSWARRSAAASRLAYFKRGRSRYILLKVKTLNF